MSNRVWVVTLLGLAAACGGDSKEQQAQGSGTGAAQPEKPAKSVDPAEDTAEPQPNKDALVRERAELKARVQELEQEFQDMEARHAQERESVVPTSKLRRLRREFVQLRKDALRAKSELEVMERRYEELEGQADSAVRGKVKEMRADLAELEKRRDEINDLWKKDLEEARMGAVEESPVKRDLYALRAVKKQWFAATPKARAGRAAASERKAINDSFRAWLKEQPAREAVAGKVLEQPLAPKGKSPSNYDFTDLDFYILMEILEDHLDRQDIAVEKKVLSENKKKLETIEQKIDALSERIHTEVMKTGGALAEFEELEARLGAKRENVAYLAEKLQLDAKRIKDAQEIDQRQYEERDELESKLAEARRKLKAVAARLGD